MKDSSLFIEHHFASKKMSKSCRVVVAHLILQITTVALTIFVTLSTSKSSTTLPNFHTTFTIKEATIKDLQIAFHDNKLTSQQLVQFYLKRIKILHPTLRAVIEVNPDALAQAKEADKSRAAAKAKATKRRSWLDGIPILLKDNIGTKDKLNTTAGSYALLGSVVARDAGVVRRLRESGAIILGKASLSEWANFRTYGAPSGWCARGGQGQNPYNLSATPCGSSSGSAIAAAANLVTVTLGTETDGSILCPSSTNSVVGIKPTVGLTSRGGVVPISPRQDTVGPICRTVEDAAYVLETIVGYDPYDSEATFEAKKYIPRGGYAQFLKLDGLKGKRLGIVRNGLFFDFLSPFQANAYKQHFRTLRHRGAEIVDNLELPDYDAMSTSNNEEMMLQIEFKIALNLYLKQLIKSPVRTLADVIEFNNKNADKEMIKEYGQDVFISSEATHGMKSKEKKALAELAMWSRDGFEKLMKDERLDAIISPDSSFSSVLAVGGFPGISVPAGYDEYGLPFGICFGGLRGTEPKLIEIAYGFEHATRVRKSPAL